MNKKITYVIIIVIAVVVVMIAIFTNSKADTINTVNDLKQINYEDTYNQDDQEYIAYFWQASCGYCKEVEPNVLDFAANQNIPLYIVDMASSSNSNAWYDWEAHHSQHDIVIGEEKDGEQYFYENVNIEELQNNAEVNWTFKTNSDGEIIALHNTPYGNLEPKAADDIEVTGTPTMIKVKNGSFQKYAVGVDQVKELLGEY